MVAYQVFDHQITAISSAIVSSIQFECGLSYFMYAAAQALAEQTQQEPSLCQNPKKPNASQSTTKTDEDWHSTVVESGWWVSILYLSTCDSLGVLHSGWL